MFGVTSPPVVWTMIVGAVAKTINVINYEQTE
jgi:hypothetical protein